MSDPEFEITPVYQSAVNAVTKPTSLAGISRYVVERWLPEMGGDGLAILAFLRKRCFYNRETGEKRETVKCKLSEMAQGCRMSQSTVRRVLQTNEALRKFVKVNEEFEVDPKRGGLYRVENSYTVSMDDPLHPSDMALLQEEIRKIQLLHEKGMEDPKERARRRAQERAAPTPSQIGRAYRESLISPFIPLNPLDPAALPGDSLSLFGGEDQTAPSAEEVAAARAALAVPPEPPRPVTLKEIQAEWDAMSPEARERYRPEALRRLREAGHPAPKEAQVGPTMFKLFWVERKGLTPSGGSGG